MYETIKDLNDAIDRGEIDPTQLAGFICKGELFVRAGTPVDIFVCYYGSVVACADICALLSITDIEYV